MITLENLTIQYDQNLILKCERFDCFKGAITLIVGQSGSGKSSFLNHLSLNEIDHNSKYSIDQKEINDQEISDIQKNQFSYVLQDYDLFNHLTIQQSLSLIASMNQETIDISTILEQVNLSDLPLHKKVSELSGGQKQRLALAMAIAKDTPYILLDEPIASLDENNKKIIIQILNSLKAKGKGIVIVTHEPEIYQSDCIYQIKDKQMICIKSMIQNDLSQQEKTANRSKETQLYKKYFKNNLRYHALYIMIVSICMIVSGIIYSKSKAQINVLESEIVSSSKNAVLVYNQEGAIFDNEFNHSLSNYSIDEKVIDSSLVNTAFPYYILDHDTFVTYKDLTSQTTIEVNNVVDLTEEDYDLISINEKDTSQFKSINQAVDEGIYVSAAFLNNHHISSIEDLYISINVNVPVVYIEESYVDEYDQVTSIGRHPYGVVLNLVLPVKGIVYDDYASEYEFGSFDLAVYMDDQAIEDLILENRSLYSEEAKTKAIESGYTVIEDQSYIYGYVATFKNNEDIQEYLTVLQSINPRYTLSSKWLTNQNELAVLEKQNQFQNIMALILIAIISILIVIIQKIDFNRQKKNYAYLKINGYNIKTLLQSIVYKQNIFIIILSSIGIGIYLVIQSIHYSTDMVFKSVINYKFIGVVLFIFVILYLVSFMINQKDIKKLNIKDLVKKA